jgi:hypothetical protein
MTQPAFQVDVLQIEPGSGTTQTIARNATTGDLKLTSPTVPAGIDLLALAGLRNMRSVYLVGQSSSGAPYTTIQSAIDAVNGATSSAANPALILIGPGVYSELITIQKDGLFLVGLGAVTINNGAAVAHTITVNNGASTPPQQVVFQNIKVTNSNPNYACILFSGGAASRIGLNTGSTGGAWVKDCHLANTAAGGYTVWASGINNLYVLGGTQAFSDAASVLRVDQCARVVLHDVAALPIVRMDYDSTGVIPATATSVYSVRGCDEVGQIVSTLSGLGSLEILHSTTGSVTLAGDRTVNIRHSTVGNLSIGGTTAVSMFASSRGTAAGTGTLAEPFVRTTLTYTSEYVQPFAFDVVGPDANYSVSLELPSHPDNNGWPVIESKAAGVFQVTFRDNVGAPANQTMAVGVTVQRSA